MRILSRDLRVADGPVGVLHDVYYLTMQYGLSVAQHTGKNTQFWRALPERLRAARDAGTLDTLIAELEEAAAGHSRRTRLRRKAKQTWGDKEVVINAELIAILCAMDQELLGRMFDGLCPDGPRFGPARPVLLRCVQDNGQIAKFCAPDFQILGNGHLVLGEIKTRGDEKAARKYPCGQLVNYMRFVTECRRSQDPAPTAYTHAAILPSRSLHWFHSPSTWIQDMDGDGRITVNTGACMDWCARRWPKAPLEQVERALEEVPFLCRSWADMADAFGRALDGGPPPDRSAHWRRIAQEVNELAHKASRFG